MKKRADNVINFSLNMSKEEIALWMHTPKLRTNAMVTVALSSNTLKAENFFLIVWMNGSSKVLTKLLSALWIANWCLLNFLFDWVMLFTPSQKRIIFLERFWGPFHMLFTLSCAINDYLEEIDGTSQRKKQVKSTRYLSKLVHFPLKFL